MTSWKEEHDAKCVCVQCGAPARALTSGRGYVVGMVVSAGSGVLHRDEFGLAASYYGRPETYLVRHGCSDPACPEAT